MTGAIATFDVAACAEAAGVPAGVTDGKFSAFGPDVSNNDVLVPQPVSVTPMKTDSVASANDFRT